ncbi:protein-L-isoaspartate(D-aspartate) O-methyltransferase [Piscinibacter sp. XHJ-5]|uniref:protein-L-isoaspartate(D-aspartate) O-methyltransferase n=1 Tax=Piscinibacter sp. XHJ-5 TaxID=3037797 RepID=UPI002452A916|nr:protein-L-isoaspartate(D-aspartate) O-methyltransferase [Piscinibacter sp. XHJ-5]
MQRRQALTAALMLPFTGALRAAADDFAAKRRRMIDDIAIMARDTRTPIAERVMSVLATLPRHEFVPPEQVGNAYQNRPLPIGHGQTISQPYIVALMTDLAKLEPDHQVLEVGTGSGYQAAVAGRLARAVYTIEIVEPLGQQAMQRLQRLRHDNVHVRLGDGYHGWEEHAPYDAVLVTAAASHVPPPLVRQLKPGGRMVIPVGAPFMVQQLMLVEKRADGGVSTRQILPVAFVPLTGQR